MNRTKRTVVSFAIASGIFLIHYAWMPGFFPGRPESGGSLFTSALISGLIFGLAGCPSCAFPLSISLSPWHDRPLKTIVPMIAFHGGRMLSIFAYATILTSGLTIIRTAYLRYSFMLSGAIMLIFSLIILKEFPITGCPGKPVKKFSSLYALWGTIFGIPCGFEATGFLIALWTWSDTLSKTILASLLFAIATVMPIMILSYLILLGINNLSRPFVWLRPYIRTTCAFYLSLLGIFVIVHSLR